jgi:hypothetical protein
MKAISHDRNFIYYVYDRPGGKSEGIRFSKSAGAIGFVSRGPSASILESGQLEVFDSPPVLPPARIDQYPIIIRRLVEEDLGECKAEVLRLLSGEIDFDDALKSGNCISTNASVLVDQSGASTNQH